MIRIDRVVTRGGDHGDTSLGDGSRVRKDSARIEAIGAVDEANAVIGWLAVAAPDHGVMLRRIQNDLFDLGADLCVPGEGEDRLRITAAPVSRLEREIASLNARLGELRSFVLPGGTEAASRAHLARTAVRRAERAVVRLASDSRGESKMVQYLNRLSDHLFVLGRVLNAASGGDVLWRPGANLSDDVEDVEQNDNGDGDPQQP